MKGCNKRVIYLTLEGIRGFPGGISGKDPSCQCRRHKRHGFGPWVRKMPRRRAWQPTPVFLLAESHGQRSLAGYCPQGPKESHVTEATEHHPCKKELSTSAFLRL